MCFTSGTLKDDNGSRKWEFRQGVRERATVEPGLSQSDGARGALAARCFRPSNFGPILLKGVVLFPEDRVPSVGVPLSPRFTPDV